jgi:branched-subunit amino acid aminotransferase/4-amino-4-deoxychorismate lyase
MTELNGRPAERDEVKVLGLTNYGHFTSMLVEDGRVRGLSRHMERLVRDCRRLFDVELDPAQVSAHVRQALESASQPIVIRVTVFDPGLELGHPGADARPGVLVTTRAAPTGRLPALSLRSVVHERDLPEVKHVGLFGSLWHRRSVQRAGFGDAVFVDEAGYVSEAATANVGFVAGDRVIWPDADVLVGVTMALLQENHAGVTVTEPVNLFQLGDMDAAFATSSVVGVRSITAIEDVSFPEEHPVIERLRKEYEAIPPDPL